VRGRQRSSRARRRWVELLFAAAATTARRGGAGRGEARRGGARRGERRTWPLRFLNAAWYSAESGSFSSCACTAASCSLRLVSSCSREKNDATSPSCMTAAPRALPKRFPPPERSAALKVLKSRVPEGGE